MSHIIEQAFTVAESNTRYEGVTFRDTVTVAEGVCGTVFENCRFTALHNSGTDTAILSCDFSFREAGIVSRGRGLFVRDCHFTGSGIAITAEGEGADIRTSRFTLDSYDVAFCSARRRTRSLPCANLRVRSARS